MIAGLSSRQTSVAILPGPGAGETLGGPVPAPVRAWQEFDGSGSG